MTVQIVEVMNNTGSVLHYYNQEQGTKFDVQPTTFTAGDGGYISTFPYKPDTVPWKSSGKKIIITTDNNGPQFAVCDDWFRFSVVGNGKPETWTADFENGKHYIMKVDTHDVKFVKYEKGLRTNDAGYVLVGGVPAAVNAIANALSALLSSLRVESEIKVARTRSRSCLSMHLSTTMMEESTGSVPDTNTIRLVSSVASKITNVNLYSGRAEVTRLFEFEIKMGQNTVNIVGFPPSLQENNVRVVGLGTAAIYNVVVGKTEAPQRSLSAVDSSVEAPILRSQKELKSAIKSARHSRTSLDTYLTTLSTVHLNMSGVEQTLEAYASLCAKVDKQILDLEEKLEEVTRELRNARGQNSDQVYTPSWKVSVSMEGKIDEIVKLSITYAVCSADWTPFYDVRVDTQNKEHEITIIYKAIITQATGETWENVPLTLGTVTPSTGLQPPMLEPWTIDSYQDRPTIPDHDDTHWTTGVPIVRGSPPVVVMQHSPRSSRSRSTASSERYPRYESERLPTYRSERLPTYRSERLPTYRSERRAPTYRSRRSPTRRHTHSPPPVMPVMPEPVIIPVSDKGDIATTFNIPGLITVPDNQDKHCVTVAELTMNALLIRYAIPAVDKTVHIKTKIKNETEYTFVPGSADIYVDGSFVATTSLPSVSPQESFDCPLGLDQSIRITYHPLEKRSIKSGSVAKNKTQSYTRRITVLDAKSTTVKDLKVIDRVPVSADERIEVKILNPELNIPPADQAGSSSSSVPQLVPVSQGVFAQWDGADGDSVAEENEDGVGKNGKFNWVLSIPPQTSVVLTLQYDISHPENLSVQGL